MKIIVFSDSHGKTGPMKNAVSLYNPDMIVHLGDHIWDADCFEHRNIPLHRVRGNCDYGSDAMENHTMVISRGIKIVMTHGHLYDVKTGLSRLMDMGDSAEADILLFGHTHIALCERRDGILLMNPGTAGIGRKLTCGLLHLNGNEVIGEIVSILK